MSLKRACETQFPFAAGGSEMILFCVIREREYESNEITTEIPPGFALHPKRVHCSSS